MPTFTVDSPQLEQYFKQIVVPQSDSHKGQNGKVLIIGGSELFHAASRWSLDIVSKVVDMVFYSSVPGNNILIQQAKQEFSNGIVVPREEIENYIEEADSILIGPGMTRDDETSNITNHLVKKYPHKKWVIDAGALQMIEPDLIPETAIITPHSQELLDLKSRAGNIPLKAKVILRTGEEDIISLDGEETITIQGGHPGMTKGGTGDVLSGLVAALYAKSEALPAAVVASVASKKSGESLSEDVGPFFNASDLVKKIPEILWRLLE